MGTSARLLIYHFGSKEALLEQALEEVRARVMASIAALAHGTPAVTLAIALERFWHWATRAENHAYFRLLFELDGLTMYEHIVLPASARRQSSLLWVDRVEMLLERFCPDMPHRRDEATMIAAAMAGLLQERLTTSDAERIDEAFACLLARLG